MDIPSLIEAAKNHDREAALSLIRYFHHQMDSGEYYGRNGLERDDVALLEEYCYWAFKHILNEKGKSKGKRKFKSADVAFGLKKPRGRPKKDTFERDLVTACFVESRCRSGDNFEAVLLESVEALSISLGGVKKAYTANRYIVTQLTDEEIQEILSLFKITHKKHKLTLR